MSEERKDLKPQTKTFVLAGVCLAVLFTHRAPAAELPDARVKRMIAGVIFEVSTNHSPDGVWLPWNSYSNYVGAANPGEFDAGWSRLTTQLDTGAWAEPGAHFLRLKRSWNP